MLFSIIVGFLLWQLRIWTAGDGKLFIAYAALIPFSSYSIGYQKWVPSISLLINIFVISLLIMLFFIILKIKKIKKRKTLSSICKEVLAPKKIVNSIIFIFVVHWAIQLILSNIGIDNFYLRILLTMVVFYMLQTKIKAASKYLIIFIALIRLIVDKSIYSSSFLIEFLTVFILWILMRAFLKATMTKIAQELFTKTITIDKLKEGMVLSETIEKQKKISPKEIESLRKQDNIVIFNYKSKYYIKKPKSGIDLKNIIKEEPEGVSKEQIEKLKEIGITKIGISHTIPFAPFIFLGILTTIIAKGNILILVMNFF